MCCFFGGEGGRGGPLYALGGSYPLWAWPSLRVAWSYTFFGGACLANYGFRNVFLSRSYPPAPCRAFYDIKRACPGTKS